MGWMKLNNKLGMGVGHVGVDSSPVPVTANSRGILR